MIRKLLLASVIAFTSACFRDFKNPPARIDTQCVSKAQGVGCDDKNACTKNDVCDGAGACRGAIVECNTPPASSCSADDATYTTYASGGACDPSDGTCTYAQTSIACPTCNAACLTPCSTLQCPPRAGGCLVGTCRPGPPASCDYAAIADTTQCSAGSSLGSCHDGNCQRACSSPLDCDDGNACTDDLCVDSLCSYTFNTADCGTCGICDGTGACVYDPTQNSDCGDAVCGFCTGLGTCGRADSGTGCATCMACNATGLCNQSTAANQPGFNCTGALTACSAADFCDGAGGCITGDFNTTTACATCMLCDGSGACTVPVANGTPGLNCNGPAGVCTAADVCNGAGACILGDFSTTTDCGICSICNGTGTCVYDDTQDSDCGNSPTCGSCSGLGTCSHASSSTFCGSNCLQCNGSGTCAQLPVGSVGNCGAGCSACNAAGSCDAASANGHPANCGTCKQCNASGSCINSPNGAQGPQCTANCQTCQSGACTGQESVCSPQTVGSCPGACSHSACVACCASGTCTP